MELQDISSRNADLTSQGKRPCFHWSDLWRAPLNDFPIRDEILFQYLPMEPKMKVLEIGPGSGLTAFRLSRHVGGMTLVDTAPEAVSELRRKLSSISNIRFVCADLGKPGLPGTLRERYDIAFAMDVLEYVSDPPTGLRNLAEVLRPGGELFLTFPNVPPPVGDGVTYIDSLEDLGDMLRTAGFRRWTVSTVELRPYAASVYRLLHEVPLRLYRKMRGGASEERPQTFDRVWSFQHRRSLERLRTPIHFMWMTLAGILRLGGSVFTAKPATNERLRNQLVIRAWMQGERRS
jgi:SAM-dependent methyltransferase